MRIRSSWSFSSLQAPPALRLGELATVADEGEILVVDVRTYLPTSAVFDQRRTIWRIRAIVFEEEQR
jgi:hypothetical protein